MARPCKKVRILFTNSGKATILKVVKNRYFNAEENKKYMLITKEMGIMETVQKYPATVEVLQRFGMGCIGCAAAHFENIEQGALAHGIDVPALMEALNRAAEG